MKALCKRENLREGFSIIQNIIPAKSTKPILHSVRIEAKQGKLELSATDLEIGIRFFIDGVKVENPGVVVIPAKVAGDFIRDLDDESVTLLSEGTSCHIKGMSDSCELVGENPEEFPRIPSFDEKNALSVPTTTFVEMVGKTAFATAKEMGRYAMHGVNFELETNSMSMVATDGRRMALITAGLEHGPAELVKAIIPTKGIMQITKVLEQNQETAAFYFTANQVAVRTDKAEVIVRLLEGEFPNYKRVIPKNCPNSVEIDRERLIQKLQLVANLSADSSRSVHFDIKQESIALTARAAGKGEGRAELPASRKGEGAQIAFNPDYLLEGIKKGDQETIRLEYNDRETPGKILLGENYFYVVMPITLE